MKKGGRIFQIFGIDIRLHFSWYFIFILIAWSLAASFFPAYCAGKLEAAPDCTGLTDFHFWGMGIAASLLLFVSVLLHELSHSLVAKAKKIKVESITLFFFGGVAGIEKEEMKPSSELQMALAGPIFSLVLSGIFYLIHILNGNVIASAVTFYLYQLNLILALFNLAPGYPLDGGRALRAILYWYYQDLRKATYIAVMGGKFFAGLLMALGLLSLFTGTGGGLWFILLGAFLYFIAGVSYEQVIVREVLSKIPVKDLLKKKYPILSPQMTFPEFVRRYQSSEEDVFVVQDKKFAGLLDIKSLEKMPPRQALELLQIKQAAKPLAQIKGLNKEDNAYTAFRRFAEQEMEVLPVWDKSSQGKLLGLVTRRMVMNRLVFGLKYGK